MLRLLLYGLAGLLGLGIIGYFTVAAPIADARYNAPPRSEPPYDASDRAETIHDTLAVADLHNDLLLWPRDPLQRYNRGHTDIPRLREGGVGLQVFAAVTQVPWDQSYQGTAADSDQIPYLAAAERWPLRTWTSRLARARYQAQKLRRAVTRDEKLMLLRTQADLESLLARRADDSEAMGTLLAVEGLHALEKSVENVDTLVADGYRMMSLTHLFDNALGGSSTGIEKSGLTDFGEKVLGRLKKNDVTIDLAHASEALVDDVLARTTEPVVVSHTGVDGTCPSPRNLSDRHIRAIAEQDGIIGVGLWEKVICGTTATATAEAMRHVADLVGTEHVALGSDYDGTVSVPFDATGLPLLTEALLEEGFTPVEIEQIMGGNVVRVLRRTLPAAE